MTPLVLGRYQLLREIASGGMATVYAARAAGAGGFQKLVAVKRMLPHMTDQRFKDMFLDEARLTANIRSPYAVATLDLGEAEDGSLFLVMDLVIGSSLAEILRGCIKQGRVLPIPAVVEIVQQAARGLHDAHEATTPLGEPLHIVHRDVSPQNILVGLDGASRITDFGVAHALERLTKTEGRNIKGKIAYCSPEQARGEILDARSDVFALGIVLWEALTHRRLFKTESTSETIKALLQGEIPDPRALRPEIPDRLALVVLTALKKDPAHRYQSALEFAEDLRRAVKEHVRTEDLRDLVKLIAGESIVELVSDIRAAIETSSGGASHSWDDGPTEIDRSRGVEQEMKDSSADTLERLKQTGQFLAVPPSAAVLAASSPSVETTPAAAGFSSTFDGPAFVPAPSAIASSSFVGAPPASAPPKKRLGLILLFVCLVSALVTVPVMYMLMAPADAESVPVVLPGVSVGENVPSVPIAPAPPEGRDAPPLEEAQPEVSTFDLAFIPHLWSAKGVAGGPLNAEEMETMCSGFVSEQAQHIIELESDFPRLRFFVHSDQNTSLVVRSAEGEFFCDDDSEGLHPVLDEAFAAGRYEVFVGSLAPSQHPEYTLGISEFREFSPRSFEEPDSPGLPRPSRMGRRSSMHTAVMRLDSRMRGTTEVRNPWDNDTPINGGPPLSMESNQQETTAPVPEPSSTGTMGAPILR